MKTFHYTSPYGGDYQLQVHHCKYANGQNRIQLYDAADGMAFATASVSVIDTLAEDEVAIKDYSENQGILSCLIREGVISQPHRYLPSSYVQIPICKLLTKTE